jgi:hypothetical protein
MPILDEDYKNTEEYLQFIRANDDPREQQELYDFMRLEL